MVRHFSSSQRTANHRRGITLTEIMVAVGLFMVIVTPIFSVFRSSKHQILSSNERLTAFLMARKILDSIRYSLYNSNDLEIGSISGQLSESMKNPVWDGLTIKYVQSRFAFASQGISMTSKYFVKFMDLDNNGLLDDPAITSSEMPDLSEKFKGYTISVSTGTYSSGYFDYAPPTFPVDDNPYGNPDPGLCMVNVKVSWTDKFGKDGEVNLSSLVTTLSFEEIGFGPMDDRPGGFMEGF